MKNNKFCFGFLRNYTSPGNDKHINDQGGPREENHHVLSLAFLELAAVCPFN